MAEVNEEYPDMNPNLEVSTDDLIVIKKHPLEAGERHRQQDS